MQNKRPNAERKTVKCNLHFNKFYLRVRKRIMLTCGVLTLKTKKVFGDSLVAFIAY